MSASVLIISACVGTLACYLGWRQNRNLGVIALAGYFVVVGAGKLYELFGGSSETIEWIVIGFALVTSFGGLILTIRHEAVHDGGSNGS